MKFMKLGSKPDSFQTEGNDVRFVATELATDIIVNVGGIKFYLHKFPLLSKSTFLQKLVTNTDDDTNDEIQIPDIPGGPAAFEICAKFCYGMTVTLNAYNVVAARCAAEYLEMHETVEKGNLIYKIEVFLSSSIFRSWKDSILVLQSTKSLLLMSEDLKLTNNCIDAIATKASIDPSKVEWSYTYNRKKLPSESGLDSNWNGVRKEQVVPKDWWVEDLCELEMDFFKRVIVAIKTKGKMPAEVIGEAVRAYTYRRVPGFGRGTYVHGGDVVKKRLLIETIIWLLPAAKRSVSCSFLLKLLRGVTALDCGETAKNELVKRIGCQLGEASVLDLLIPNPGGQMTTYDVDVVLDIVEEFVRQEQRTARTSNQITDEHQEVGSPTLVSNTSKIAVSKLIDAYLAEISKDANLPLSKFIDLAEMLCGASRPVHDGLYRAVDVYLKEHPELTKGEKKKLCNLMDCRKLSADACAHAVQNERLPLRVVVQVLFFEQARAAAGNIRGSELEASGGSRGSSRSGATTNTENDWDAVPNADDIKSLRSLRLVGGSERSSGSTEVNRKNSDEKGHNKVKGVLMPKTIINKLWSNKSQGGENSSSDTSESPGSANMEESKSTPSRNLRHSVS